MQFSAVCSAVYSAVCIIFVQCSVQCCVQCNAYYNCAVQCAVLCRVQCVLYLCSAVCSAMYSAVCIIIVQCSVQCCVHRVAGIKAGRHPVQLFNTSADWWSQLRLRVVHASIVQFSAVQWMYYTAVRWMGSIVLSSTVWYSTEYYNKFSAVQSDTL